MELRYVFNDIEYAYDVEVDEELLIWNFKLQHGLKFDKAKEIIENLDLWEILKNKYYLDLKEFYEEEAREAYLEERGND